MFELNKNGGSIAIGLLILVAITLVITTLFSFASFKDNLDVKFVGTGEFLREVKLKQQFVPLVFEDMLNEAIQESRKSENFEESFDKNLAEIAERRRNPAFGNLFVKLMDRKPSDYKLETKIINEGKVEYELNVRNVFFEVSLDGINDRLKRIFDLKAKFNEDGVLDILEIANN